MKKISALFLSLNIIYVLSGQGIVSVQKIGEFSPKNINDVFIYALPRTTLAIKVVTKNTKTYCGPYFAYAEEYLGLKSIISENKSEWSIDSVDIFPIKEVDPDEFYAVKTKKGFNPKSLFYLTESGFILDPSFKSELTQINFGEISINDNSSNEFKELSMQKFYYGKSDTFYKTVIRDSAYIRIPLTKTKEEMKSLKDKAKEAADVIIKIRQRKFEMILSEDGALPEVKSFRMALDEMNRLEEYYLELFIGRSITTTYTTWFYYTPIASTKETQFEIFRFSPKSGISDRTISSATPVFLTFEKDNNTKSLNEWLQNAKCTSKNQLYYRIPDAAIVNVIWKGNLLASKKILISQFGAIVPFPVNK